jgi:hypothetical protein
MTRLIGITSDVIDEFLPVLGGWLALACAESRGRFEPEDVISAARKGEFQIWVVADAEKVRALIVTRILTYPRTRVGEVLAVVGEGVHEWVHHIAILEAWAKANGCSALVPIARPGWEKVLKPLGYAKTHVFLEKAL